MQTIQELRESQNFLTPVNLNKSLLVFHTLLAFGYFLALLFWFPKGSPTLFWLLILGEVFHLWQLLTYLYTIWDTRIKQTEDGVRFIPAVDIYITVAGEPIDVVRETVEAAKNLDYPRSTVYILNDGLVTGKENWEEAEILAKETGVHCITRQIPGGAKAGNINHALGLTSSPFIVIFDADHVPHRDFLKKTVGYFADKMVGFVQSPQYYKNHKENYISGGAWEQQELFFAPICRGKDRLNSVFMCGTNMVIRKAALFQVGGMVDNIAEDFVTSVLIHQRGWKSKYVPEVLAEGLAPTDFFSYYKQQHRWARGSLEVIFHYNPLFRRGLSWAQTVQYIASASYYLSGLVILLNTLLPLVFFFTGLVPFQVSTMSLAAVFLPYIFLTVYILRLSSNYSYTYRAVGFSMSSWVIHVRALFEVFTGMKIGFNVTSKQQLTGNFLYLAAPHLIYIFLVAVGISVAIFREGLSASVIANSCWAIFNIAMFMPFIVAAAPSRKRAPVQDKARAPAKATA